MVNSATKMSQRY